MPTLSHVAVHPIKGLDPVSLDSVGITDVGGLAGDRAYAFVCDAGYVNGKRTAAVHRLRADVDLPDRVTLRREGRATEHRFHLEEDREALERWVSEYFGTDVSLEVGSGGSQTDGVVYGSADRTGPTLVSRATLREVAGWFDGVGPDEMRRRLRPNLVVEGVPAFWEDNLVADGGRRVRIGEVSLEGTRPIPRCIVPARDPRTGEEYPGFRETFVEKRERTLPGWTDRATLDGNMYTLTVGTHISEPERDGELRVGDEVELVDTRPV